MKDALRHGVTALLVGAGLMLALLGCLGLMAHGVLAVGVIVAVTGVMTLCSTRKITRFILMAAIPIAALAWIFLMGGIDTLTEILRAITLQLTGLTAALPLVAQETVLILALLVGVAAFSLTYRSQGVYPSLAVVLMAAIMLWLTDQPQWLWWLSPAVAGVIVQAAMSSHEGLNLRRALPLAAAVAAVSFLIVPPGGVTVQPLKDAADELREKIFDYFFYTEPRNVFTLASEGYYPQGQTQLGGKAEPTDHPVMQVKTPRKTYLRGSVKNEYTGRMWLDTIGGRRYVWVYPQWAEIRTETFNMNLPQGTLGESEGLMLNQQVSVRMLTSSASSMFVPQRVRELNVGGDLVPYFSDSSEIFATRDLQEGDTYTVTAPLMVAGDAGLGTIVTACASNEDPNYQRILEAYTTLPDHLQDQVYELARRAVEGAQTPYDQAFALQNFLSRNYRYSLDVENQPENIDFVSNFLLNTEEGYCTYFASAMTVLCRMIGLPARYVEGYLAEPDAQGHAYVTGLHGHAWTEVYFPGFGWLTFDATPSQTNASAPPENPPEQQPEPTPTPSPEENELSPDETPTPQPSNSELPTPEPPEPPAQEPPENDPPSYSWLWWLLVAAAIAAAVVRIVLTQPVRCAQRAKDEMGRWSAWMQAVYDGLRVMRLPREVSESPIAYMRRLDSLRRIPADMTPLGECMALVFYGRLTPEPEETAMAAQAYVRLTTQLAWWQKAQLALMRAFTPAKKRLFTK